MNKGKVSQVIGPVVDVDFSAEGSQLPNIYNALVINRPEGDLIMEVQQHLGENRSVLLLWTLQMALHVV